MYSIDHRNSASNFFQNIFADYSKRVIFLDFFHRTGNHGCLWIENIADNEVTPTSLEGLTLVPELPGKYIKKTP